MTIYVDKNCHWWNNDQKCNEYFINYQIDYIMDLIRYRGYIYLNQIYEILDVKWDPKCDNPCIENSDFTVVIGWEDKTSRWRIDIV